MAVLQVYYPGQFDGPLSIVYQGRYDYIRSLNIQLASGERILRPSGLTDVPGGAAVSGFYACFLGTCLLLAEESSLLRLFSTGSEPLAAAPRR